MTNSWVALYMYFSLLCRPIHIEYCAKCQYYVLDRFPLCFEWLWECQDGYIVFNTDLTLFKGSGSIAFTN